MELKKTEPDKGLLGSPFVLWGWFGLQHVKEGRHLEAGVSPGFALIPELTGTPSLVHLILRGVDKGGHRYENVKVKERLLNQNLGLSLQESLDHPTTHTAGSVIGQTLAKLWAQEKAMLLGSSEETEAVPSSLRQGCTSLA